ncbi:MAG: hypothetical protein QW331_03240, partial [Candidatus Woesearchaeota archaeon]
SIVELDRLQSNLKKRGIKITQKDLIAASIKIATKHRKELLEKLPKKDNTKENMERFLSGKKYDFGKKWMEEIDITF